MLSNPCGHVHSLQTQVMSNAALKANEAVWQTVSVIVSASVSRNFYRSFGSEHKLIGPLPSALP